MNYWVFIIILKDTRACLDLKDGMLVGTLHEDGAREGVLDALNEGVRLLAESVLINVISFAKDLHDMISFSGGKSGNLTNQGEKWNASAPRV